MRKSIALITFFYIMIVFSACDLQLPKAVHITGTPKVRIAATMDIGSLYTDILKDSINNNDDELKILDCPNIETQTYIVYKEIHSNKNLKVEDLGSFPGGDFVEGDFDVEVDSDISLLSSEEPIEISFSDFGDLFEDLILLDAKMLIFVTGTEFINNLTLGVKVNDGDEQGEPLDHTVHTATKDFHISEDLYLGTGEPINGVPVELEFDGTDIKIEYRIFVKQGDKIPRDEFVDGAITVELVVWLPLVFTVKDGASKGVLNFPEDTFFDDQEDLFGRSSPEDSNPVFEYFEYLRLDIGLNKDPFSEATLVVKNTDVQTGDVLEITNEFTGSYLSVEFTEEDLKQINDSYPFIPKFGVEISPEGSIIFPRNLIATHFTFTARINYRTDF
jgi:hypothetical protein